MRFFNFAGFLPVELNRFAGEATGLRAGVSSSSGRAGPFPLLFRRCQAFLPKSLEVEMLDELTQGHLPWLLLVIVELTQLFGIHPQISGHLNLSMG
jgi:hypothetical protein